MTSQLYLVLDIEVTGQHYLGADQIVCIAWCFGTGEALIQSGQLLVPLRPSLPWADYWAQQGFARKGLEFFNFWSRQENLDRLNAWKKLPYGPTVFQSQAALFAAFDELLQRLEAIGTYAIVTDTTCFDTVWLDVGLRKHGFPGLNRSRDGVHWFNCLELDSLLTGLGQRSLNQLVAPPLELNHALADNDAVVLYQRLVDALSKV
jgi:hypothetical protein